MKRILIIGGPGSGKTTLISNLQKKGYDCLPEVSREVIKQAQEEGIEQLFLEDALLFSQKLLEGRLKQFKETEDFKSEYLFYDRGMPDVTIYMDFIDAHYPIHFSETCRKHRYDAVFILPFWKEIYKQDNERYESFEQAEELYRFLKKGYRDYGYEMTEVPLDSVEKRTEFILEKLKTTY